MPRNMENKKQDTNHKCLLKLLGSKGKDAANPEQINEFKSSHSPKLLEIGLDFKGRPWQPQREDPRRRRAIPLGKAP